jgi:hypothetical protein
MLDEYRKERVAWLTIHTNKIYLCTGVDHTLCVRSYRLPIFDIFSKRQKKLRGDVPDLYVYDDLPQPLRTQIIHIWLDTLGHGNQWWEGQVSQAYSLIVDTLCREYGIFKLQGRMNMAIEITFRS